MNKETKNFNNDFNNWVKKANDPKSGINLQFRLRHQFESLMDYKVNTSSKAMLHDDNSISTLQRYIKWLEEKIWSMELKEESNGRS